MKGHLRRWLLCGAAATAILGALGGFAYAKATSDNTISACAKTANGQLRLDTGDGCLPSEQAIQWNQTGPQGPSGVSHVDEFGFYQGPGGGIPIVSGVWPAIRGHETTVLTFHLDPGQYLVSTQLIAINNDGRGVVVCQTGNHALGIALMQGAVGNSAGMALQQTMQDQSVFDVPTGQDLTVDCFNAPPNDPAGYPFVNYVDVTATKIDSSTFNGVANP
jgi:hypothetical protein